MPESNNSRKKPWTLLVYLAGDNNLTEEMVWSLQEMKKASSNDAIHNALNLVALFDPPGENPRRYEIVVDDRHPDNERDGELAALTAKEFEYDEDAILEILREQVAAECVAALNLDPAKTSELAKALENYPPVAADSAATILDADRDAVALAKVARLLAPQLGARLRFVSKDNTVSALVSKFLLEQVERLPSTHCYAVILSGHGSGAVGDFLTDNDPKSAVSIPKLGKILEGVKSRLPGKGDQKIQILGMDSCLMSTIEVAYEVQESVEYLVASEGSVLNAGWPYHRVLEAFAASAAGLGEQPVARDTSQDVADNYIRFYRDYEIAGVSTDIAVCALDEIGLLEDEPKERESPDDDADSSTRNLAYCVHALATAMTDVLRHIAPDGMEEAVELRHLKRVERDNGGSDEVYAREVRNAIVAAHWSAQSYKGDRYVDLYDFCQQLLRFCPTPPKPGRRRDDHRKAGEWSEVVHKACENVLRAMEQVVIRSRYTGTEFQHSHGLSIYFPWAASDYLPDYRNLRFAQHTRWAEFLETYMRATARMRRDQAKRVEIVAPGPATFGITTHENEPVIAQEPIRRPRASLMTVETPEGTQDPDAGTHRNPLIGTDRNPLIGTDRGQVCSTMKNPPDGYYEDSQKDRRDEEQKQAGRESVPV
jgi:hypothetical protein